MSQHSRKDWIDLFEKRIEDLETKLNRIEEHVKILNQVIVDQMTINFQLSVLTTFSSVKLEDFDLIMELIKHSIRTQQKLNKPLYQIKAEDYVDSLITLAKKSKIPFQTLVPYLIQKLGKELAKTIVKEESILQHYGNEGLAIWKLLLSST